MSSLNSEKTAKVSALLDESKFSSITRNLFLTLAANGRVGEATKVYIELVSFHDMI
jgi:hypothetical protein